MSLEKLKRNKFAAVVSDDDLLKRYSKGIVEQIREFGKA
jgi:hypothetical protein